MATSALQDATIRVLHAQLKQPTANSVFLNATVQVSHFDTMGMAGSVSGSSRPLVARFEGEPLGEFSLPILYVPAGASAVVDSLATRVHVTDMHVFTRFCNATLYDPTVALVMEGHVTIHVSVWGLFHVSLHDVPVNKALVVRAMGGIPPIDVLDFTVHIDRHHRVVGKMHVIMKNPSAIDILPMGNVSMALYYGASRIGTLNAPDLNLYAGSNALTLSGVLLPSSNEVPTDIVVSRYLAGQNTKLWAHGLPTEASTIPLYAAALANLTLDATLPGHAYQLGQQVTIHLITKDMWRDFLLTGDLTTPVQVMFWNPLDAALTITAIHLDVEFNKTKCGHSYTGQPASVFPPLQLRIPANGTSWSNDVVVAFDHGKRQFMDQLQAFYDALHEGDVLLGLSGHINVTIGDLQLTVAYAQGENVPTCMDFHAAKCDAITRKKWGPGHGPGPGR